jgi:hypothetical protein
MQGLDRQFLALLALFCGEKTSCYSFDRYLPLDDASSFVCIT